MPNVVPTKKASPKGLSLWGEAAYPVDIFRNRFEDWFRRFWQEMSDVAPAPEGAIGTNWECELHDDDKQYVVKAEAPGLEPKDFDIQVKGDMLVLSAEHDEEKKSNGSTVKTHGTWYRAFTLPSDVKPDAISASYDKGILTVQIPKDEKVASKKIAVKAK